MDEDITADALLPRVEASTANALELGTLGPIGTREEVLRDGGYPFRLRIVASLARKESAQARARAGGFDRDPFQPPYEEGLYVGRVPPAHVGLLNKFPVLEHHLLLVTERFEPQEGALDVRDCEALLRVLGAGGGLVFYNGGETAGASQPHRHLQWVPLTERPPLEAAVGAGEALPFPVASEGLPPAWLDEPAVGASGLHECYARLLTAIGCCRDAEHPQRPAPNNLLATRDRVWAVPRTHGSVDNVAINALGYAGWMLAADEAQAGVVRTRGPLSLLAAAASR
jgi:ATP adenylyltransferase